MKLYLKHIKHFMHQTIFLLSYILIGVSFLSIIIPKIGLEFDYVVWGNIGGYSLITNYLFIYIFTLGNYCWTTRMLPLAMCLVNIINILGVKYPKYYESWYEVLIFSVILIVGFIIYVNKRINR